MEASAHEGPINEAFNTHYNTGECRQYFKLTIDRKVRPTVLAVAENPKSIYKQSRQDLNHLNSDLPQHSVFKAMLKTLIDAIRALIPAVHLKDVYLTFSWGNWQRSGPFHIKAHLTTDAFLVLINQLCANHSCEKAGPLKIDAHKSEENLKKLLEEEYKIDHFGGKLRRLEEQNFAELESSGEFLIGVCELDYPLVSVYKQSNQAIPIEKMPAALNALERYVQNPNTWNQKGGSFSMVLTDSGVPTCVAAVISEKEFVCKVNDTLAILSPPNWNKVFQTDQVKEDWDWKKGSHKWTNPPFLVPGGTSSSSYLFAYSHGLEGKVEDLVLK